MKKIIVTALVLSFALVMGGCQQKQAETEAAKIQESIDKIKTKIQENLSEEKSDDKDKADAKEDKKEDTDKKDSDSNERTSD